MISLKLVYLFDKQGQQPFPTAKGFTPLCTCSYYYGSPTLKLLSVCLTILPKPICYVYTSHGQHMVKVTQEIFAPFFICFF